MKMKHISLALHVDSLMSFCGIIKFNGDRDVKYSEVDFNLFGYFNLIAFAKDSEVKYKGFGMTF